MTIAVWASLGAVFVAGLACVLRRWRFAARVSKAIALTCPLLFISSILVFIVLPAAMHPGDPSMKATVLSQGISQVVNCGGLALAAAVLAGGVWALSRRRLG